MKQAPDIDHAIEEKPSENREKRKKIKMKTINTWLLTKDRIKKMFTALIVAAGLMAAQSGRAVS